jgi:hypothetical protein
MSKTIDNLLKNSGLPGPRGNLGLMYTFIQTATKDEIKECFIYYRDDLSNSPEEFVVMCGVAGLCFQNKNNIKEALLQIRSYASHKSWRIREAVAIGIQEISEGNLKEIIYSLNEWIDGNELEKRAVVAALSEPKLLKEKSEIIKIFEILYKITSEFEKINGTLSDGQNSLRKTLGYGWSVVISSYPEKGKTAFSKITKSSNKHIRWIVKENLKKNRLKLMDKKWVEKMLEDNGK